MTTTYTYGHHQHPITLPCSLAAAGNPFTRTVVIGKGSGNGYNVRRPWELLHFLEMPAQVSTSAACFFAAARFFAAAAGEPLLVLVSLSLSGISLRLFGLLA